MVAPATSTDKVQTAAGSPSPMNRTNNNASSWWAKTRPMPHATLINWGSPLGRALLGVPR